MSKHVAWTVDDFVERATGEFSEAMAGLDGLEGQIREALDELEDLNGGAR